MLDVTENGLEVAKREGGKRAVGWESGVGRYTLLHLEKTNNDVLLYHTGNCYIFDIL